MHTVCFTHFLWLLLLHWCGFKDIIKTKERHQHCTATIAVNLFESTASGFYIALFLVVARFFFFFWQHFERWILILFKRFFSLPWFTIQCIVRNVCVRNVCPIPSSQFLFCVCLSVRWTVLLFYKWKYFQMLDKMCNIRAQHMNLIGLLHSQWHACKYEVLYISECHLFDERWAKLNAKQRISARCVLVHSSLNE